MYKSVKLYENIENIIDSLKVRGINYEGGTEMEDVELAFLCGLIQEKRPKNFGAGCCSRRYYSSYSEMH